MSFRRIFGCVFFSILLAFLTISPSGSTSQNAENSTLQATALIAGRNINMISGKQLPFGDPFLQRQNEPSIAVSSRNPMHILAGANDYRTVDLLIPYEEIPGFEGAAARDAWLGLYKSFDGGQSWKSSLLPGFPLDYTNQGSASPLKAYGAAADPVVRAGTSGMFYYCGLAFNRNQTENSVFVARLIDNNNTENQSVDSIKYIDAKIIDKGNAGQFIDKPWLAVDIPRSGAKTVPIQTPGVLTQNIKAGNVYLAYSIFTGQAASNPFSKVYLARSIDCGTTWENATKLSESSHVNQGVTIAISPATGYIYVAWRRFAHGNDGHAIMSCYSTDGGKKFSNPKEVAAVQSFDQGTTGTSFRTNTYPALTVDHNGIVYLAWAQRGIGPGGDARIVVSTSGNGVNWSTPQAVDNHSGPGHQFMPALSYSAGKVTAAWYDQRYDVSQHWHSYISDEPGQQYRHTIDIRAAQAAASASPLFEVSAQVSRYLHLTDADGQLHQVQFSPPNFPMFKEGTTPFHGDYVDLTPAPMFVPVSGGGWAYNIDGNQSPVFHAAWTDNRNVKPPKNGNWSNYAPPSSTQDPLFRSTTTCQPGQTSMRNQDVYMASLTRGLIVGSPANMKPLNRLVNKHTFVVFVKNMTSLKKRFRLTIVPVTGVTASFKQFTPLTTLEVEVARYSSVSRTVFATGSIRFASIRVNVEEISGQNGGPVSGGLKGYVVLNPDIENPDIENPDIENNELHNPDIENPDIENPDIENVNVLNPDIENPDIENPDIVNPDIENPDIENPDIENPDIENPGWLNPDIENPDIENPDIENGSIRDYTWKVANTGNTASAYAFKMISAGFKESQYPGFGFQLLIYRVHTSPAATSQATSCVLTLKHHDELMANIIKPIIFNPDIENPDIENPDIENPDIENATLWLAPGDKAYITLRVYDPNKNDNVKFDPAVTPITGVTTGQAVNSVNENDPNPTPPISSPITTLMIWNSSLPNGTLDTAYSVYLVALGGTPHYTWSKTSGSLPAGLSLNPDTGVISGTPTTAGTFNFTIQVVDSSTPTPQTATKAFSLLIPLPCSVSRPNSPTGTGTGGIGINYTFTASGSTDSEGHAVEYRLDWGDGTFSNWITTSSASHAWAAANPDPYLSPYEVKVQSRCHVHPSVVSAWSSAKKVSIFNAVSTISGTLKYNGNPITNMPDASGKEAVFWVLRDTNNWVVPISATYDKATGNYSIPNIPEGQYGMTATIDAAAPYDGNYYPGDYNGYVFGIIMPASPVPVTKDVDCQKLLHLVAPIDNAVAQHWPGPVYDAWPSPIVLEWGAIPGATIYRYRVDKYQSDPYLLIETGTQVDTAATQVSLGLPASGTNDHYQFELYAYSSTGSMVGKFMIVYTSGNGWDYRFRIVGGDGTPPQVTSFVPAAGATDAVFDAPLKITFDESVTKGTGNILVKKRADDAVFQTINVTSGLVTVASNVVTIGHDVLGAATGYYVQIEVTCFDDLAGNSYAGISDKTTWSFTTADVAGLLAYYPFNGSAADASGNGNEGTIRGSTPVFLPDWLGQANGALQFNGVDNYVDLPNESRFDLTAFTIVAIVKVQNFNQRNYIISKGQQFGNYTIMIHGPDDGNPGSVSYAHQTDGGNWSAGVSGSSIPLDQFVHLAAALDANSYFSYMNGQRITTSGPPTPPVLNDTLVTIGRATFISAPTGYLDGVVDEIRFYSRVLSDNEIKALYNKDR